MSEGNKDANQDNKVEVPPGVKPQEKKKELQKDAEVLKMLEEDEDDFEEFEEGVYDETAPIKIDAKQWRQDWDDQDINDEFGTQLRKELGINQ